MLIKKIIGYTTPLFFIVTAGAFGVYNYMYFSIIPTYQKKLTTMIHERSQEINKYLNEQEKQATELSSSFAQDMNNAQEKALENVKFGMKNTGFKNLFFIDKSGTIIFSTTQKDNIIGTNIYQQTDSSLKKTYERASLTLTTDFSTFTYNELLQEPALFITIPILKEKKFIGALIYQLNQEKIYMITNQYIGLGKTGEVVLAKKEGSDVIFLSPTRNDADLAFKKRVLLPDQPLAIQASIIGQNGSGTAIDYRDKKIIGAWQFIPKVDWGIIIKIDHDEIVQSANKIYNVFLLFLITFILGLLLNGYLFFPQLTHIITQINRRKPCNKIPALFKQPLFILFLLFTGLSIKNIVFCEKNKLQSIEKSKKQAIATVSHNSDITEAILKKIAFVGQSIANDLRTQYLKQDDINTRITRDLAENSTLTEIIIIHQGSDGKASLYSTQSQDQATVEHTLKTAWYTQAKEKGSVWLLNHQHNNNKTATYACTFVDHNNNPQGVIALTFSLKKITDLAEYSGIGQTGYGIIMADDGTFIYHPLTSLVQKETTLLQYAQSQGNEELAIIAQKVITKKSIMASYTSKSTHDTMWIYTHPIQINGWIVGTIFSQDEIGLSSTTIRHHYFWILIWVTITLLLLCALLWQHTIFSLSYYIVIANILLLLALISSWRIIKNTTIVNRESRTIITDQSALNKFLNDLDEEAHRKHEAPPINIPCGILVYSLSNTGPDNVTLSGYLWNKYNTKIHTDIIRGMDLPQATRMVYGAPLLSQATDEETSTWNIQGVMYQEQTYEKFPFDQQELRIILEHRDIEKNIILTPDLTAYKKLSPESTPGLSKEFTLSGFTIEQSFFEYQKVEPKANFGLKGYGKVTDNYHLVYNAIITRNLLNPFVIYVLPLLVILFTLFTTLLVIKKTSSALSILGAYSGLFFALIVLQRSMREQYPSGSTLYMEYAFFYTYITIILLILHTIIMYYYKHWEKYQQQSLYLMRILFWPFQWITWLITTLIIFY